jgi:hypothetical protein
MYVQYTISNSVFGYPSRGCNRGTFIEAQNMATYNQGLPPPPIQCQIYPALESLRPETCRHCGFCLLGRTYCILLLFMVSRPWQDSRPVKPTCSHYRGEYGRNSLCFRFPVTFFLSLVCFVLYIVETPRREGRLRTGSEKLCTGNAFFALGV